VTADRITDKLTSIRTLMKCKSELIYFVNNIPRQLHENSCLRSAQDWTTNIGEYHWLFIIMSLLWNNTINERKYYYECCR